MEDRHVPSDVFIPPDDVEVSPPTPQQFQQYFSPSLPSVSMKIKDDWMTTLSPQPREFSLPQSHHNPNGFSPNHHHLCL